MKRSYIRILAAFASGMIVGAVATFIILDQNVDTQSAQSMSDVVTPQVDVANLFDGQTVEGYYVGTCGGCHGAQREGAIGPALLPETLTAPRDFYFDTIKNGRSGTRMPPWGAFGVTDAQIDALLDFLLTEPA